MKLNPRDKINYPSSNKKGDWIISKRQKQEFQNSAQNKPENKTRYTYAFTVS